MSDRLRYPVGNTNGRDHIYYPILTPAEALANSLSPRFLSVNLATMMALAWRVKTWRIAAFDVAATLHGDFPEAGGGGGSTDEIITTAFTVPQFDIPNGAVLERGLINTFFLTFGSGTRGGLRNAGWSGNSGSTVSETTTITFNSTPPEDFDPPSGSASGTFDSVGAAGSTVQIGTGGFNGVFFDPVTKLFYPEINFGSSIILHYGGALSFSGSVDQVSSSGGFLTVDPVVVPTFQLPLQIAGHINPFRGMFAPTDITSAGISPVMTAQEFWPYANSVGDPIYDTADGSVINDPFS